MDPVGRDAGELERRDLVAHQRHQRGHHHRETVPDQRRHLHRALVALSEHSDLPEPVGITVSTLRPASSASITAS